jgi:excisionase family DNA binding protein
LGIILCPVVSGKDKKPGIIEAGKIMQRRTFYTTFEISQICGVNPTSVQNWVKAKKLKAFQTPGGHRRIRREDLISFMKEFGMPLPAELTQGLPTVMIVDDEVDILDMLEDWMKSDNDGVQVIKARSGVEALLLIGESKPNLLILDIMMPGMNGYDVCQKLKASPNTQNIRIVAISGDHHPAVRNRIMSAGADLFFTKPLEFLGFREQCFQLLEPAEG